MKELTEELLIELEDEQDTIGCYRCEGTGWINLGTEDVDECPLCKGYGYV